MEVILQTGNFLVQGAIVYGGWVQGSRTLVLEQEQAFYVWEDFNRQKQGKIKAREPEEQDSM